MRGTFSRLSASIRWPIVRCNSLSLRRNAQTHSIRFVLSLLAADQTRHRQPSGSVFGDMDSDYMAGNSGIAPDLVLDWIWRRKRHAGRKPDGSAFLLRDDFCRHDCAVAQGGAVVGGDFGKLAYLPLLWIPSDQRAVGQFAGEFLQAMVQGIREYYDRFGNSHGRGSAPGNSISLCAVWIRVDSLVYHLHSLVSGARQTLQ